jgi:hypothetical protein
VRAHELVDVGAVHVVAVDKQKHKSETQLKSGGLLDINKQINKQRKTAAVEMTLHASNHPCACTSGTTGG